uniref:Sphingomyelin phosphodiesterase n=1 Tax=Strongyloides papillosus TaxID=174720 RepID=A0A0N5BGI1_STREA
MKSYLFFILIFEIFCHQVYSSVISRNPKEFNEIQEKIVRDADELMKNNYSKNKFRCKACHLLVDLAQKMIAYGKTVEEIEEGVIKLCEKLNVENNYVCNHTVHQFSPEFVYVLVRTIVTPQEICGAFIADCGTAENPLNNLWPFKIPDNKPPVKPWPIVKKPQSKLRVLHLTDIHLDRDYKVGSVANCNIGKLFESFTFCCRAYPNIDKKRQRDNNKTIPAGYWGSPYDCDIPFRTFINAMEHLSKNDKFDYIIVTGDLEAHDIWDYTRVKTMTNILNISAVLNEYFPNTPIYQATGNHEGVPMDSMGSHTMSEYNNFGPSWLYKTFARAWKRDLPPSTQNDIKFRASYSVKPYSGLKIISLNTVYCSIMNLYNLLNQTDPDGTLEWLSKELLDSESKGEKVHIITHIPPGIPYCLKGWSFNFYRLVNRFENTIAFLGMGHTHQDHFEVYYDNDSSTGRPTNINWIAPSLTTFSFNNPAYRVYEFDGNYQGSTFTVLEAETYYTNISEATQTNPPVWKLEYKFTQEYGMPDLSPKSFNDLIVRLEKNETLFNMYHLNYYRNYRKCDEKCKEDFICSMKSARSFHSKSFCQL